jgi:hypothetical protein
MIDQKDCTHKHIIFGDRWYGVFPQIQYGICTDCGLQMKMEDGVVSPNDREVDVDK